MESMGVVVRRYIDYLKLLILTPLVSFSSIPTFCSFLKCFRSFYIYMQAFSLMGVSKYIICTGVKYKGGRDIGLCTLNGRYSFIKNEQS